MYKTVTINNEELMNNLIALCLMCADNETDNCDLTLETSKGNIVCHITFEAEVLE